MARTRIPGRYHRTRLEGRIVHGDGGVEDENEDVGKAGRQIRCISIFRPIIYVLGPVLRFDGRAKMEKETQDPDSLRDSFCSLLQLCCSLLC